MGLETAIPGSEQPQTYALDRIATEVQYRQRNSQKEIHIGQNNTLTFQSLAATLRTTRFNIQKSCVVFTLRLCDVYGSQNKQRLLHYITLTDWFCITEVESLLRGTD